jgi:hypothetical protein
MPALARKITPDHHDYRTSTPVARPSGKAAPRRRWHEDKPAAQSSAESAQAAPATQEVAELLSHFGHGGAQQDAKVREQVEVRREARRRARRHHRPFRLTLVAGVLVGAPLFLLASLLGLRSNALALSRRDAKLQDQISVARFDLERTRKEIAALNASPHIEQWAKERGWQRTTQKDFDQVPAATQSSGEQNDE